jgi:hypothetical protein
VEKMKKYILLIMALIIVGFMGGCYNYEAGSNYGKLEGIAFFDADNEEIIGEYKDYFQYSDYFDDTQGLTMNYQIQKLNSPAPVENYYCADVIDGADITVRLKIKFGTGYEFYSLEINHVIILAPDFSNLEIVDEYVYVNYLCTDVSSSSNEYEIGTLKMKTNAEDSEKIVTGSTWIEGRTYISGFYFHIIDDIKFNMDINPFSR